MFDLTEASLPLAGAALGVLIGWALFNEEIVSCGVIGCSIGLLTDRWRRRRNT